MWRRVQQAADIVHRDGLRELTSRIGQYALRTICLTLLDPHSVYQASRRQIFEDAGVQFCYNEHNQRQYDEEKMNVFVATESPAVVERYGWIDESLDYDAEISFGNFYALDQYYCPRELYATFDGFVELDVSQTYTDKDSLVSHVFSEKTDLPGHDLRHEVGEQFSDVLDLYGSGADNYINQKTASLDDYMFQVVIENGKYPEYVSEKFFDCLKTNTVPIYWGGEEAVRKMGFDTDGILFFESTNELSDVLTNSVSRRKYKELREQVEWNRRRLLELRNNARVNIYFGGKTLGFTLNDSNRRNLWLE